jgi:toluene monooxygenase electron transfer component
MSAVTIAPGNITYDCDDGDTLLRAALRAGLGLPYECSVGSCGTCKVTLVAGDVESRWPQAPGLTDKDRAKNRVLACQSLPRSACTIKAALFPDYEPLHRPQRFAATLEAAIDLTHDLREFRFRALDAPRFAPGQYALLSLPGVDAPRAYSMCNLPDDGAWHFAVKRVPGGAGTTALFDALSIGDAVTIDGAYGRAYLRTDSPRDIVCIAGGSGLSPMIAVARAMAREPALAHARLHFFYGGRGPRDICGESLLAELPGYGERIRYYAAISMPELDPERTWRGEVGYVHELAARTLGARLAGHEVYFAGPPAMAHAVQVMLLAHEVPPSQMHFDSFY